MYIIQWQKELSGEVTIGGSKNAALPLIAACLLVKGKTTLRNVPDILDVHDFIHFYKSLGAKVDFTGDVLTVDNSDISLDNIDTSRIERTRAWIYFLAGLLHHFGQADMPLPSGDKIGKRPIGEHLNGYMWMGYSLSQTKERLIFNGKWSEEDVELMSYFAVSATLNLILWAAARKGVTTIKLAAFEPHIFNLIDMLRNLGTQIDVRYDHTLIIRGGNEFKNDTEQEIVSDYLQSWTFAIIAALCAEDYIDIHRARIEDLGAFLHKLHATWVKTEDLWNDTLRVYRAKELKAVEIQTNIFPGFPTDLMPLFSVLMTQCEGTSRIHEILYEWRLNWLVEYERIGGQPRIINLHEAKITGPTPFVWNTVNSWDLRSGAAMVIAGLIATGETKVDNVYWIKRGYDDFLWKLLKLWAQIEEIEEA